MNSSRIGEVIEASTTEFTAQCDELHNPPPLGTLVVTRDGETESYAFVSHAETASIDPGRRPVARGAGLTDEEELYRRHPELGHLLRTLFTAVVVAHGVDGRLLPYLPPRPPRVHAFVRAASQEETRSLSETHDLLSSLAAADAPSSDEFIAAALRGLAATHPQPQDYLVEAGRRLTLLLRGDTQRLQALLRKLRPPA